MKVFFTASFRGKQTLQNIYDKVIKTLHENDIEVISREIQVYGDFLSKQEMKGLSEDELRYLFVKKGIAKSDAVIIEASYDGFGLGHESTLALVFNKPVLCLSSKEDYTSIIKHPKFFSRKYSSEIDIKKFVNEFLEEVREKHLSVRFNGFLSPQQKTFLDWYSNKHKRNTSEVIRDFIDYQIENSSDYYKEIC